MPQVPDPHVFRRAALALRVDLLSTPEYMGVRNLRHVQSLRQVAPGLRACAPTLPSCGDPALAARMPALGLKMRLPHCTAQHCFFSSKPLTGGGPSASLGRPLTRGGGTTFSS